MTRIEVYDTEAKLLEQKADELDTTIAELVEMLCDYLSEIE